MRAAAILGLGCRPHTLDPFRSNSSTTWSLGLPASQSDADAIAIFGGDGTLHRHLPSLVKLQLPVLIVPAGSGNDFARALQLHHIKDSLSAWQRFEATGNNARIIDLGTITPLAQPQSLHYFACVAGCGLDGEVARRANALPRWMRAHGGYALSLPASILRYKTPAMKISVAEASDEIYTLHRHKPTLLAAFANAPAYGDGMKIAPHAKLDDGQLDVCCIDQITSARLLRLFPTVYFGKHLGIPEVEYFQTSHLRLEADRVLDVYADGEYVCQTPVEIGVRRSALQVITL